MKIRWLLICWLGLLAVDAAAVRGVTNLFFSNGLEGAFRSDTQRYHDYEDFLDKFGTGRGEVLVLFRGADFAEPGPLNRVADFLLDAQFIDGVVAAVSPFSFRLPGTGDEEMLIPTPPPPVGEMKARLDRARSENPQIGRFISADRQTLLVILSIQSSDGRVQTRRGIYSAIDATARQATAGSNITATVTGYGVLGDWVVGKLFDDFIMLNAVGAAIGTVIAFLTLRSWVMAAMTTLSAATALLWVLGAMATLRFQINVVTIALPALVLVLSFADAVHLGLELRRQHAAGAAHPAWRAVRNIAPAAALAAATTAIAFASLMTSSSAIIWDLGAAGAMSTILLAISVFLTLPLLFATVERLLGRKRMLQHSRRILPDWTGLPFLSGLAFAAPRRVALIGMAALLVAMAFYATIKPEYSLFENINRDDPALVALRTVDRELAPVGTIGFRFPLEPQDRLIAAHAALQEAVGDLDVVSIVSFASEVDGKLVLPTDRLNEGQRGLLVSRDGTEALFTVLFPYRDASDTRAFADSIAERAAADPRLAGLSPATGIIAVSSYVSRDILNQFTQCFLIAIAASGVLIAIWMRSAVIGLIAMIPNVLPVVAVGAALAVTGVGLQFTSGIALTIAFGLAIDDTVHVLNRMRLNGVRGLSMSLEQVTASLREVAPALVITSAVLSFGITGTLLAALPSVRLFGELSIAVFALALAADLVLLPALLILLVRRRRATAAVPA